MRGGEVPELYWYLFWVGLAVVVEAFGFYMASIVHRRNMRCSTSSSSYAEKGMEPPAEVARDFDRSFVAIVLGAISGIRGVAGAVSRPRSSGPADATVGLGRSSHVVTRRL
jgi:hypothetical protein